MAKTVQEYIDSVPNERKDAFERLVQVIRQNIDPKTQEELSYGMLGWVIPKTVYPAGYHVDPALPLPFIALANQKNYIALYHLGLYANQDELAWFTAEYAKTGYKLDMGKSCIRFKNTSNIPFELIAALIKRSGVNTYIKNYTAAIK